MKKILKKLVLLVTMISIVSELGFKVSASDPYIMDEKWNQSTLKYYVTDDRDPTIPASKYTNWIAQIDNAANMWNNYLDNNNIDLKFVKSTDINDRDVTIMFDHIPGPATGEVTFTYGSPNFSIIRSLVELDDYAFDYYQYSDSTVKNIVAHELGHVLGLKNILNADAVANGIYSIMIYDTMDPTSNFRNYPTSFDISNLQKNY